MRPLIDPLFTQALIRGVRGTAALIAISVPLSLLLGYSLGVMRVYLPQPLRLFLDAFSNMIRGMPLILLLFIVAYGFPDVGITLSPFKAAVLSLTVNSGCYMSEYVKNSILNLSSIDILVSRSLGLSKTQELAHVVFPRVITTSVRPVISEMIYISQNSTLGGLIGVYEVYSSVKTYVSYSFEAVLPFAVLALFFVALSLLFRLLGHLIEKKFIFC